MRMLVAGVLVSLALTLGSGSTYALCGGTQTPAQSLNAGQLAFVGTVGSVRNERRWATFQVQEVWHPRELPRFVEVRGGTEESFLGIFTTVSSNDRFFEVGVTYLVFPELEGDALYDNDCSATQEWSDRLAALRPSVAHPPSPSLIESSGGAVWAVVAAALAVLTLGAAAFWRRRPRASGGEATAG